LNTQLETGTPYLLYKDSCNSKSNQQNLGTIQSSNLCTEIIEYTDKDESAVCNLASISLKKFVIPKNYSDESFLIYSKPNCVYCDLAKGLMKQNNISYEERDYKTLLLSGEYPKGVKFPQIYLKDNNKYIGGYTELEDFLRPDYDFDGLEHISSILTYNLNNIIDYNYYPIPETKRSNKRHRPIGIGVQGLANVFFEMNYAFDSEGAKELNDKIFETIYYGSMKASMDIAKEREPYMIRYKKWMNQVIGPLGDKPGDFVSSDEYNTIMKYLREVSEEEYNRDKYLGSYSTFIGSPLQEGKFQFDLWNYNMTDNRHNWSELKEDILRYGVRNSLLVAPMPTASTSQIMGNYECFEPITSNIYTRRVLSGEYTVLNEYLINDLISLNLWNNDTKQQLISNDGSIQNIKSIPDIIKNKYKTVWELKQKPIIDLAVDRGKYICQSQSLNLFLSSPSASALTSMHFYSWKKGLKTGIYYLRSQPSSKAIKFTIDPGECESCSA
jgi:ribonucleotide reductase alpha subunit